MTRRIAVFDYRIVPTNPSGSCHLRMLRELCREHDFTVFAVEFENPCPERISFVRIPVPTRPLALLFVLYRLLAPLYYLGHRLRHGVRFDTTQVVECNVGFADTVYAHFCHRSYLARHWRAGRPSGLRRLLRWLDHALRARLEPRAYRRARCIVVPSRGLARELSAEYSLAGDRITVLPNPVDHERLRPPPSFPRAAFRQRLGLGSADVALAFVALGQFERKGLPLLLDTLRALDDPRLKLVVVGGEPDLVAAYRARVAGMAMADRVQFVGMQRDISPYLWSADALALPSLYEVFPLVALEAAAAGLPLVVTPLHGVEEFIRDGENGFLVNRTAEGMRRGLARLLEAPPAARAAMGERARRAVAAYTIERFVAGWRAVYARGTVTVAEAVGPPAELSRGR